MREMATGQVFAGWRVERELARGGMGVIYLARHPRLPRTDVLKVLPAWLADDERFRERFLREASRVGAMTHPHIVVVHDSGEHAGTLYLVMQYLRGGDLRGRLSAGPLPPEAVVLLAEQIASALDAAHRAGIVHRDVKPENVLLAETGPDEPDHAVLTDFGISRDAAQLSTLTATGELLLTPAYAAPEQVVAGQIDGRADQYALACMLYELLTGGPPYARGTGVAVLAAHVHEPVRHLPTELGLPAGLDEALVRAMAKEPEHRFPNCRAFSSALRQSIRSPSPARASTPAATSTPTLEASDADTSALPVQRHPSSPGVPPQSYEPTPVRSLPAAPAPTPVGPPFPSDPSGSGSAGPSRSPRPPRRSRRSLFAAAAAVAAVLGAAGVAVVITDRGGNGEAQDGAAAAPSPAFAALLDRVPSEVRDSCTDTSADLSAQDAGFVTTRADCRTELDGQAVSATYSAIRGDESVGHRYRREVLGLGGVNHAPGDCRTLERDPEFLERESRLGIGMPAAPPLDADIWCDYTGVIHLLQPGAESAVLVRYARDGDDGSATDQPRRFDQLARVQPS